MALPVDLARDVTWIVDGVGLVRPPPDAPHAAASLLIAEADDVVLVDAGIARSQRERLAPHVDVLLLTHCHVAHACGAADFGRIWAPAREAPAMDSLDAYLTTYGIAKRDGDLVSAAAKEAGWRPATVAKRLQPGSILRVGRHEWHLVAAPGHSPGMLVLHEPRRHIVFAADLDGETPPWYGLPTSDPSDLERTLLELVDIPTAHYVTSHAEPRRRGIKPMLREMAQTIRDRDRLVLQALDKPRTLDDLTGLGLLLGKPASPMARYHERIMVEKHLARLMEKDFAAARQDGRFQRLG